MGRIAKLGMLRYAYEKILEPSSSLFDELFLKSVRRVFYGLWWHSWYNTTRENSQQLLSQPCEIRKSSCNAEASCLIVATGVYFIRNVSIHTFTNLSNTPTNEHSNELAHYIPLPCRVSKPQKSSRQHWPPWKIPRTRHPFRPPCPTQSCFN